MVGRGHTKETIQWIFTTSPLNS